MLTKEEAIQGMLAIKVLHGLADKTGEEGISRAVAALHEHIKRYGEKHHADVVARGGTT